MRGWNGRLLEASVGMGLSVISAARARDPGGTSLGREKGRGRQYGGIGSGARVPGLLLLLKSLKFFDLGVYMPKKSQNILNKDKFVYN
jgi:hypothetical protein